MPGVKSKFALPGLDPENMLKMSGLVRKKTIIRKRKKKIKKKKSVDGIGVEDDDDV